MFFKSKYKKLLNIIKDAHDYKYQICLENGVTLDFRNKWTEIYRNCYGHALEIHTEKGKYYLITRKFPTGNKKMEVIKCDSDKLYFPEFTIAAMELDIEPYDGQ